MNDNLLISAVQAAFDEAVQKAVAVHLGPLRAKLDAVEAAASLVRTQAELVPSLTWTMTAWPPVSIWPRSPSR